jgi:hypothetical protein
LDDGGNVWDAFYDNNSGWHSQQINGPPALPLVGSCTSSPSAAGGLSVSVFGGQQHFAYLDDEGNVWDAFYDNNSGWHSQQINAGSTSCTLGPPAVGGVVTSVFGGQQHFAYLESPSGYGLLLLSVLSNSPANPNSGSVRIDLLGGNDFALAASSDYVSYMFKKQNLTVPDFGISWNWSVGPINGTISYNLHVNSITVGLGSGQFTLTIQGHAHTDSSIGPVNFPDTDFTITQNFSLTVSNSVVTLNALGDPSIGLTGILGSIQGAFNGSLVSAIKPTLDQSRMQLQTSIQSMLNTQTQSVIQSLHKSLQLPAPQVDYSGVTVESDGIILFGSITFTDQVPAYVQFTQRDATNQAGQIELNALASWIPGGTIGNETPSEVAFIWTLSDDSGKQTVITENHKFVTRINRNILGSRICLTVLGTRVTGQSVTDTECQ